MEKQTVSSRVRNFSLPYVEGSNLVTDCPDYRASLDTKLEQTHSFRPFLDDSSPIWYVRGDVRQSTLCPQMIYQGIDRLNSARRKPVVKDNTGALKLWLIQHKRNPYPNKPEKIMLAILSKMTLTQVSTWFANARRRLKKEYPDEEFELIAESLQQNQHFTER